MPVPFEIDSLDNIAEPLREHYAQTDGGKFRLNVDGLPAQEDVTGLKSALDRTRAEAKENRAFAAVARELGIKNADDLRPLATAQAGLQDAQINHQLTIAMLRAKATGAGVELLTGPLRARVAIEGGKFRIAGVDGKPMPGTGADGLATFDDLVKETITRFPELFEGSGIGGGGASGRRGGGNAKTISRRDFDKLPHHERNAIVKRGFTVVDDYR